MNQLPTPGSVPPQVRVPMPPPLPGAMLDYRGAGGGVDNAAWRRGNRLCTINNAILPTRCVRCNSDENVRMKRKQFAWCTPWIYFSLLAGWLIALILILVLQKKATITYGTCGKCRMRSTIVALSGGGGFAVALLLVIAGISAESGVVVIMGFLLMLAALIFLAVTLRTLRPKHIDQYGRAEFGGCCEAFLASL